MRWSLRVTLLIAVVGVAALRLARPRNARDAVASLPVTPPATLVLLGGVPGETVTSLYRIPVGAEAMPPPFGRVEHVPGAVVRATPRGDDVLVVADRSPRVDASWGAELLRVDGEGHATLLCDRVAHAARPLVTASGRVLVERGRAGVEVVDRHRVDDITVDEIDPRSGEARALLQIRGYTAHLAATVGELAIVYRVDEAGATLLAVDGAGTARTIAAVAPFARDFSVDGAGRLVLANRDVDAGRWTIDRVDLDSGAQTRLWSGESGHAAPRAVGADVVAYNPDSGSGKCLLPPCLSNGGLAFLGATDERHRRAQAAFDAGVDVLLDVSPDGAWAALLHHAPDGGIPQPRLLRLTDGNAFKIPAQRGVRYQPAGFLP